MILEGRIETWLPAEGESCLITFSALQYFSARTHATGEAGSGLI
jgi:hypothetical protein